jgi:hypothetical protein
VVTAAAKGVTYGGTVPSLTYSYTGLVNGDSIASVTGALATTATSSSPAGSYPITEGTLAATGNYTIGTFNGNTLTVNPAPLAMIVDNQTKVYGAPLPALTFWCSGWVNNDTPASLTTQPTLTTTATASSPVLGGPYPITAAGAVDPNYKISYTPGSLTVTLATATIVVTGYDVSYDGKSHTAMGTATGVGGVDLSGELNLGNTTHTSAGVYGTDPWTFTDASGNYTSANGTVSDTIVGPVDLTHSTLTALPSPIGSSGKVTVTLTARDAFGSQELTGGLAVALSVKGSAKGSMGKVTDNHNGTYTANFTAGSTPGVDTFSATINKKAVKATASLTVVGPYSLAKSVVSVPASSVALGTPITVTLTAMDALGHQELTGGLKVVFSLAKGSAGGTFGTVTDNHNGTYTATFTGNKAGGDTITATINGKPLTSKAPKITVTAQGGVRLPAEAAATSGLVTAQDAALLALLAESNGGTTDTGTKKGLSISDLWSFDEE